MNRPIRLFIFFITLAIHYSSSVASSDLRFYGHLTLYDTNEYSSLDEYLILKGYEKGLPQWKIIVIGLNLRNEKELNERNKIFRLYLPYKEPLKEFKKQGRYPASSEKPKCNIVDRIEKRKTVNDEAKIFMNYVDMVTYRKFRTNEVKSPEELLDEDFYSYENSKNIQKNIKHKKIQIKDSENTMHKYLLPFCTDDKTERSIAYLNSNEADINGRGNSNKLRTNLLVSHGKLDLIQDSRNANMNFQKLTLQGTYSFRNSWSLSNEISIVNYRDVTTDSASGTQKGSNIFPEFKAGLSKSFNGGYVSLGINIQNYFFIEERTAQTALLPSLISRFNLTLGYNIYDNFSVFTTVGSIVGLEEENLTGKDLAIGLSYSFGDQDRFRATFVSYSSRIDPRESITKDESKAAMFSLGYEF